MFESLELFLGEKNMKKFLGAAALAASLASPALADGHGVKIGVFPVSYTHLTLPTIYSV